MWAPEKIKFHPAVQEMDGRPITYADLYREIGEGKKRLPNACILDFALDRPEQIISGLEKVREAKSCKCNTHRFFFFGTLFVSKMDGGQYVRYLNHDCCGVHGHYFWLGRQVHDGDYVVLFSED